MLELEAPTLLSVSYHADTGLLCDCCFPEPIKTDIRFMYLMEDEKPSFKTIGEFISSLEETIHEIFVEINKTILTMDSDIEDKGTLYIDGTAYEANANKFSFVWKKTAEKTRERKLEQANEIKELLKETMPFRTIKESKDIDELLKQINNLKPEEVSGFVYGRGKRKTPFQRKYDELVKINETLKEVERRIEICGEERNSYSKVDHDATFMHMKYDYYNNTGVFKPGYNLQAAVTDEYVSEIYISNERADSKTLPLTVDRYQEDYGRYPTNVIADAGYGSYTNYMYLLKHGINAYVKYITVCPQPPFWDWYRVSTAHYLCVSFSPHFMCPHFVVKIGTEMKFTPTITYLCTQHTSINNSLCL